MELKSTELQGSMAVF